MSRQAETVSVREKIKEARRVVRILTVSSFIFLGIAVFGFSLLLFPDKTTLTFSLVLGIFGMGCFAVFSIIKPCINQTEKRLTSELDGMSTKIPPCPECGKQTPPGNYTFCPFCNSPFTSSRTRALNDPHETAARVYPAVSHRRTNLEPVPASRDEKKLKLEAKIPLQKRETETRIEEAASILEDYLNARKNLAKESCLSANQGSEDPLRISGKPEIVEQADSPAKRPLKPISEKTPMLEQDHAPPAKNTELTPTQDRTAKTETASPSTSDCQYGFGYLSQREKGEGIPDTCVGCPKSLDCMLSEYYKKRASESIKEIKKWYGF